MYSAGTRFSYHWGAASRSRRRCGEKRVSRSISAARMPATMPIWCACRSWNASDTALCGVMKPGSGSPNIWRSTALPSGSSFSGLFSRSSSIVMSAFTSRFRMLRDDSSSTVPLANSASSCPATNNCSADQ
ncbi:Uncharacterised protein [Burkholderia pseudomallei]|nr:Uncharacterised protein [Burkholderia pseudomallei]